MRPSPTSAPTMTGTDLPDSGGPIAPLVPLVSATVRPANLFRRTLLTQPDPAHRRTSASLARSPACQRLRRSRGGGRADRSRDMRARHRALPASVAHEAGNGGSDVQGSQQARGRQAARRDLYRARQQVGQSVPHRRRRRPCERATVIAKHTRWLHDQHHLLRALDELRGKDLLCFCTPAACHGDLLLRLANATREERIAWWRSAA